MLRAGGHTDDHFGSRRRRCFLDVDDVASGVVVAHLMGRAADFDGARSGEKQESRGQESACGIDHGATSKHSFYLRQNVASFSHADPEGADKTGMLGRAS
jgi:hypothetical protein